MSDEGKAENIRRAAPLLLALVEEYERRLAAGEIPADAEAAA